MSKMLRVNDELHKKLQYIAIVKDVKMIDLVKNLINSYVEKEGIDLTPIKDHISIKED